MTGQADDRAGTAHDRLLEAMNSGVLATDESGRITAWNPGAQQLLGYTRGEVLGKRLHRLLHRGAEEHVPTERDCRLLRALHTGVPDHEDRERFAHRDGRLVMCSWASAPIYTGDPTGTG
ncbi:PAS domain S-box protein, partial [Actinomadura adrarensis]